MLFLPLTVRVGLGLHDIVSGLVLFSPPNLSFFVCFLRCARIANENQGSFARSVV